MKKEDLKKGYRLAKPGEAKDGLTYFLVREDSDEVSRRSVEGDNTSDFDKWVSDSSSKVYVENASTTSTTSKASTTSSTTKASTTSTTTRN